MTTRHFAASVFAVCALATSAMAQSTPKVEATVTKVDATAEKITLKHGAIPNLGMSEMTMVFRAGDKAMLTSVQTGDKVTFTADRVNGQITITSIQKTK